MSNVNAPQQVPDMNQLLAMFMMQQLGLGGQTANDPMAAFKALLQLGQYQQMAQQQQNPRLAALMRARQNYNMGEQMNAMGISQADRDAYGLAQNPGALPAVAARQANVDAMKQRWLNSYGPKSGNYYKGDEAWLNSLDGLRADQQQTVLDHMFNRVGPERAGVQFAPQEYGGSWQSQYGAQLGGEL